MNKCRIKDVFRGNELWNADWEYKVQVKRWWGWKTLKTWHYYHEAVKHLTALGGSVL